MPSLEDLSHEDLIEHTKALQQSDNLFKTLLTAPDTRERMQRLIKEKNPNLSIPEIDSTDRVMAAVAAEKAEREKLEAKILERDVRDKIDRARSGIKDKYKLNDEEVLEVEKLMTDKENPIPTHDAAARVFKASRTVSEPTPMQISAPVYDMPDAKIWGAGIGNKQALDRIFLTEATKVLNEGLATRAA
jgi:hypothetical protein